MLLHGAPSVPRPMFTFARWRSGTLHNPDASLEVDVIRPGKTQGL